MKRYQRGVVADLIVYLVIAAAATAALALVYHAIGNYFRAPVEAELKTSQAQTEDARKANESLRTDLAALQGKVLACNAAVDSLSQSAAQRIGASEAALRAAAQRAASAQATVDKWRAIAQTPTAKGATDACADIDTLLNDIAADRLRFNGTVNQPSPGDDSKNPGAGALRIR